MPTHSCKLKRVVADMAFFTPSFWKTHGVKTMPTGRATPWPNRAETAVRLFKRQYEKLLLDASVRPMLNKVTLKDLIRECYWARNTTLTSSGYTPVERQAFPAIPPLLDCLWIAIGHFYEGRNEVGDYRCYTTEKQCDRGIVTPVSR